MLRCTPMRVSVRIDPGRGAAEGTHQAGRRRASSAGLSRSSDSAARRECVAGRPLRTAADGKGSGLHDHRCIDVGIGHRRECCHLHAGRFHSAAPPAYPHQERLMRIIGVSSDGNRTPFPKGWIRELNAHSHAFSSIAAFGQDSESNLSDSDVPDRVFGAAVSVNALDTLGIRPALGDFFSADDAIAGQDHDVVLSDGYWRQHFGGSPSALGRSLRIDGVSRRIVGVMPAGVHFPHADTQFVIPISFRGDDPQEPWKDFNLQAFGRLADGAAQGQAQAELRRLTPILLPLPLAHAGHLGYQHGCRAAFAVRDGRYAASASCYSSAPLVSFCSSPAPTLRI